MNTNEYVKNAKATLSPIQTTAGIVKHKGSQRSFGERSIHDEVGLPLGVQDDHGCVVWLWRSQVDT